MDNSKKILLVEDYKDIREMLAALLIGKGFQVSTAIDGSDGLKQAQANPPDLIVTDTNMPKLSGIDMTKQLRQMPEFATTPIIVLSSDRFVQRAALQAGANEFLKKPMSFATLLSIIERLLGLSLESAASLALNK